MKPPTASLYSPLDCRGSSFTKEDKVMPPLIKGRCRRRRVSVAAVSFLWYNTDAKGGR